MRCMVIGADSYIGSGLIAYLRDESHQVCGTTRRNPPGGYASLDLSKPYALPLAEITFFCAGITSFKQCDSDPEYARVINVASPKCLAANLAERGGKVVMLSSSAVETHPDSTYGKLKRQSEGDFLTLGQCAAVVRFGPVMKPGRAVYADAQYNPVSLSGIVSKLGMLCSHWSPGVHRILSC